MLSAPYFRSKAAALVEMERILWPAGPVCPHCGGSDRITVVGGMAARRGLRRCLHCKKQFTVTVGTVFESSHVPLTKWLRAAYLMAARGENLTEESDEKRLFSIICRQLDGSELSFLTTSKIPISSRDVQRELGITYKTAWYMTERLREAFRQGKFAEWRPVAHRTIMVDEVQLQRERKIWLTPRQLSARYKGRVSVARLASWRSGGHGPRFYRYSGKILYAQSGVKEWEKSDNYLRLVAPRLRGQ